MTLRTYEYQRTDAEAHEQANRHNVRRDQSELAYCSPPRPAELRGHVTSTYVSRRNRAALAAKGKPPAPRPLKDGP